MSIDPRLELIYNKLTIRSEVDHAICLYILFAKLYVHSHLWKLELLACVLVHTVTEIKVLGVRM